MPNPHRCGNGRHHSPTRPRRARRTTARNALGSQLAGQPITVPADTREPYLLLRADGTAEDNGSCNRFRGSFFSENPSELKFTPLMSTRMTCPAIDTENAFTRALGQASTYRISGDTLRMLDATGAAVVRLEAVYLR
ncbi:META domain-containing protein [Hymenobacter siberiensis]|uniref:META domain-containing protein n=1 Tax=Hymenobacter siberiensis TaxID=2848396 RepID=UPI001C1E7A62|nr:META domain-containing protein [Hymenobacter siberiensis]